MLRPCSAQMSNIQSSMDPRDRGVSAFSLCRAPYPEVPLAVAGLDLANRRRSAQPRTTLCLVLALSAGGSASEWSARYFPPIAP